MNIRQNKKYITIDSTNHNTIIQRYIVTSTFTHLVFFLKVLDQYQDIYTKPISGFSVKSLPTLSPFFSIFSVYQSYITYTLLTILGFSIYRHQRYIYTQKISCRIKALPSQSASRCAPCTYVLHTHQLRPQQVITQSLLLGLLN